MRKTLILSIILFVLALTGCGQEQVTSQKDNVTPDFRNVSWGMSMSEVKENETEVSLSEVKDGLFNKDVKVDGIPFFLSYHFVDDKLYEATYQASEMVNDNSYVNSFASLKSTLSEKYGQPVVDKTFWVNENSTFKDNPTEYGYAVASGDLAFVTQWEMPTTAITLTLAGFKLENSLLIMYISPKYNKLADDKEKDKL